MPIQNDNQNQRISQTPQNQPENLRRPPSAGGPRRIPQDQPTEANGPQKSKKKSLLKKALKYALVGGVATGISFLGITDFFS